MWYKSVDTTNKICNKQEELNTRKDKDLHLPHPKVQGTGKQAEASKCTSSYI